MPNQPACHYCGRGDTALVLAAYTGENAEGERTYVAFICESCAYAHGQARFADDVHERHGPVQFVTEPGRPWEARTYIPSHRRHTPLHGARGPNDRGGAR
ncbi:MAG TPA: hypothetical protein VFW96_26655 [Thermomicrobiales bacterium]|nr:hypothetical protein [Thermomicrobiales bacterium]